MKATRPRLDKTVTKALRAYLRKPSVMCRGWNPAVTSAAISGSMDRIWERTQANPYRLWDLAWDIDSWACTQRVRNRPDGGAYDLATHLYDAALERDPAILDRIDANRCRKFRDTHDTTIRFRTNTGAA